MITYDEGDWHLQFLLKWNGSVVPTVCFRFALPSASLAVLLTYLEVAEVEHGSGIWDLQDSQIWTAVTAITIILLGFRTRQALGRFWEGTGLLHQMRGEWFDAISCLMAFSRQAKTKPEEVLEFRHTLVRLTSLMHGCALHEIKDEADEPFEVIDLHGLDHDTLSHLRFCKEQKFNLVEVLLHMIQVLVTENHEQNIVKIPPPICSRVYQELSRGMVNLHNAKKITDTQFPFPYAQLIMILLLLHSILTPIVVSSFITNPWWAGVVTFVPVFGMFAVNLVANELEMPFGEDANDLNLHLFQEEMNNSLCMLIHDEADHMPHTTSDAVKDFYQLKAAVKKVDIDKVTTQELKEAVSNGIPAAEEKDVVTAAGLEAVGTAVPGI